MRRASWVSAGAAAEPGRRGTGVAIACDGVARVWVEAPARESSRVRPLKVETVVAVAAAVSRSVSGWRRWVSEACALGAREGAEVCRDGFPEPDFDPCVVVWSRLSSDSKNGRRG